MSQTEQLREYCQQISAEREMMRRNLYWALRTRVLSIEEMEQVRELDYFLIVDNGEVFIKADKQREFNQALVNQFMMHLAADKANA